MYNHQQQELSSSQPTLPTDTSSNNNNSKLTANSQHQQPTTAAQQQLQPHLSTTDKYNQTYNPLSKLAQPSQARENQETSKTQDAFSAYT
jgi:hypothetical protein